MPDAGRNAGVDLYEVTEGDQLYQIMQRHYGRAQFWGMKDVLMQDFLAVNPAITDINRIYPGQVVALPVPMCLDPTSHRPEFRPEHVSEIAQATKRLGQADTVTKLILKSYSSMSPATDGAQGIYKLLETSAQKAVNNIRGIETIYGDYKAGTMKKSTYFKQRGVVLDATDRNLGILNRQLGRTTPTRRLLRMDPRTGVRAASVEKATSSIASLGKRAKIGGGILTLAQIGVAAHDYTNADTQREKTRIVLGTSGSILASGAAAVLFVAAVGTPVGWLAIGGIALTTAVAGSGGQWAGEALADVLD